MGENANVQLHEQGNSPKFFTGERHRLQAVRNMLYSIFTMRFLLSTRSSIIFVIPIVALETDFVPNMALHQLSLRDDDKRPFPIHPAAMANTLIPPVDNNLALGEGSKLLEEAPDQVDLVGCAALGAEVGDVAVEHLAVVLDLDTLAAVRAVVPGVGREGDGPGIVVDAPAAGTGVAVGSKVGGVASLRDGGHGGGGEDGELHLEKQMSWLRWCEVYC